MKYEEYVESLRKRFPKFEVRQKNGSTLMKLIHFVLMVITLGKNQKFISDYITTVGYTVYVPEKWEKMNQLSKRLILLHESVHMEQMEREGKILFGLKYLFWPLPIGFANARLEAEAEAYAREIFEEAQMGFAINFDFAADQLCGAGYFWPTFSNAKARQRIVFHYKQLIKKTIEKYLKSR